MKRIITFFLAISVLLIVASCGSQKNEQEKDDSVVTVAFFLPHMDNPFMNSLSAAVHKYAAEAGFELVSYVAGNDAAKQTAQLAEAVDEGVNAIILDPCSNDALAEAVASAGAAGIPVVTLHESISTQGDCASFVGPDFSNGGKQAMARAMDDLPQGGNIAVVYGMEGHSAQIAISAGYPEALAGKADTYPIVAQGYGNWVADDAQVLVAGWLSEGKSIDAIVCNNDGMASGALAAVKAAGLEGKINIYGLDAQSNILDAIKEGTVKATIYVDIDAEASQSVGIVKDILAGKSVSPEYLLPMILITAENVDEYRG